MLYTLFQEICPDTCIDTSKWLDHETIYIHTKIIRVCVLCMREFFIYINILMSLLGGSLFFFLICLI